MGEFIGTLFDRMIDDAERTRSELLGFCDNGIRQLIKADYRGDLNLGLHGGFFYQLHDRILYKGYLEMPFTNHDVAYRITTQEVALSLLHSLDQPGSGEMALFGFGEGRYHERRREIVSEYFTRLLDIANQVECALKELKQTSVAAR